MNEKYVSDDPDEIRYEMDIANKDQVSQIADLRVTIDEIEIHLRYGIPRLKFIGWVIVFLLCAVLWRIWK